MKRLCRPWRVNVYRDGVLVETFAVCETADEARRNADTCRRWRDPSADVRVEYVGRSM